MRKAHLPEDRHCCRESTRIRSAWRGSRISALHHVDQRREEEINPAMMIFGAMAIAHQQHENGCQRNDGMDLMMTAMG